MCVTAGKTLTQLLKCSPAQGLKKHAHPAPFSFFLLFFLSRLLGLQIIFLFTIFNHGHIRADFNYPSAVTPVSELCKATCQLPDIKPPPLLHSASFWKVWDLLIRTSQAACTDSAMEIKGGDFHFFVHKEVHRRHGIYCIYILQPPLRLMCEENASGSFIEEVMNRHMRPPLSTPSCASAAATLFHPTHFDGWCQQCVNIYSKMWRTSHTHTLWLLLSMCPIESKNLTNNGFSTILYLQISPFLFT